MGLFKKIFGGLAKTATNITHSISQIFTRELDDDFYDDLTAVLLSADMGVEASEKIIADIKQTAKKQGIKTEADLKRALAKSIANILEQKSPTENTEQKNSPQIIMIVGVNGVGKTTSIGKLAHYYKSSGKSVLLIAGDTFRAAATEQLETWAERAKVRIVKQTQGSDPASVVFDGLSSAKAKGDDIVIIDTAGRLHNKTHLVEELKKIDRVVAKVFGDCDSGGRRGGVGGDAPLYQKYIVLDATTGGNAVTQVEVFNDAVNLDGVILTKLDGTAKGGVVVAIKQKFDLDVVFAGIGEKIDDIVPFNATDFANGILGIN
jgi:fused signal recognition particle receptor